MVNTCSISSLSLSRSILFSLKQSFESDKLDIEHVFTKNEESLYNDAENKKVGDQVVTFEVKEDQEFDM